MTKKSVVVVAAGSGFLQVQSKYKQSFAIKSPLQSGFTCVERKMKNVFVFVSCCNFIVFYIYMLLYHTTYYIIVPSSIITQRRPNHGTGSSDCTGA